MTIEDESERAFAINDEPFLALVDRLKALREFLSQAAIALPAETEQPITIGQIYSLHFSKKGRPPSVEEWNYVDSQIQRIYGLLGEPQRKAFLATETPWSVPILIAGFLLLCLFSIILLVYVNRSGWINPLVLGVYVIYSLCLGALGALGSISLNAIQIQNDIKFDPTNLRLIVTRMISGALFGCIINLPFGYAGFYKFIIIYSSTINGEIDLPFIQAASLLLPFIFGYSTSSLLIVLDRLAASLRQFFGDSK